MSKSFTIGVVGVCSLMVPSADLAAKQKLSAPAVGSAASLSPRTVTTGAIPKSIPMAPVKKPAVTLNSSAVGGTALSSMTGNKNITMQKSNVTPPHALRR